MSVSGRKSNVIAEMARQINNDSYNKYVNIDFEIRVSKAQRTYNKIICTMKYKQLKSQRNGTDQRGDVIVTLLVDLICALNPARLYEYCSRAGEAGTTNITGVYYDPANDRPDIYKEYMNFQEAIELAKVLGYDLVFNSEDCLHFKIKRLFQ